MNYRSAQANLKPFRHFKGTLLLVAEGTMPTAAELREMAFRNGSAKKRSNAIVAILSGAAPGLILACYSRTTWGLWLLGLAIGLVWGNAFEYSYHRWLLHRPGSSMARGHLDHHIHVGTPEEPEHVSLGKSPAHIAFLFAGNGSVVVLLDRSLHLGIASGIFIGWTVYLIAAEEVHWRIHMNGWLPPGLRFARAYHMGHHDIPNIRYNVFLPLFDLLLGNRSIPVRKVALQ